MLQKQGRQLWREAQSKLSYAVAYSPAGPAIGGLPSMPCLMQGPSHPLSQVCRHPGLLPYPGETVYLSTSIQATAGAASGVELMPGSRSPCGNVCERRLPVMPHALQKALQ